MEDRYIVLCTVTHIKEDQILSVRSIGDGKPEGGCGSKHNKVRRLLPWDIYPCVTIPCGCVEVKGARLRELDTVDSPFCRGITEGGYVCMILPVKKIWTKLIDTCSRCKREYNQSSIRAMV